jgi:ubiquinone/menaquinone biosynthesis C-methylase UbiE
MERLLGFLPQRTGKILDVACGVGATSSHLVKYFRPQDVTGIDISDKQLDTCRRKLPDCEFKHMNAENLQFNDHSFDCIICVEAAFHFHTREDFLREAKRTLKLGGILILSDALISSEFKDQRPHYCEQNAVTDLSEYKLEYLRSGFSDVKIVDATASCWHKFFWHVVRFTHQKLLDGVIIPEELNAHMFRINLLAADLKHYVLVAAMV